MTPYQFNCTVYAFNENNRRQHLLAWRTAAASRPFSEFPSFGEFYPDGDEGGGLSDKDLREECRAKGHKEPDLDD